MKLSESVTTPKTSLKKWFTGVRHWMRSAENITLVLMMVGFLTYALSSFGPAATILIIVIFALVVSYPVSQKKI